VPFSELAGQMNQAGADSHAGMLRKTKIFSDIVGEDQDGVNARNRHSLRSDSAGTLVAHSKDALK